MPFDGQRMIWGGFAPINDSGRRSKPGYVDGCVIPVPAANLDAYREMADKHAAILKEYGATRTVDAWGDDVPDGKVTDYKGAVQATKDERIVYSWVEWPSKEARDIGWKKAMEDPRMNVKMPFDGKRMIYGGFKPILDAWSLKISGAGPHEPGTTASPVTSAAREIPADTQTAEEPLVRTKAIPQERAGLLFRRVRIPHRPAGSKFFPRAARRAPAAGERIRRPSWVRSSMPAAIVSISGKPKASAALDIFCAMRWMCAMAAGSSGNGASGRQALIWATSACVRVRKRSDRACCDICDVLVSPVWDTANPPGASSLAWRRVEYRLDGPMLAFSSSQSVGCVSFSRLTDKLVPI